MGTEVSDTLRERGERYGDFAGYAKLAEDRCK